jgi:hypothetical protein
VRTLIGLWSVKMNIDEMVIAEAPASSADLQSSRLPAPEDAISGIDSLFDSSEISSRS